MRLLALTAVALLAGVWAEAAGPPPAGQAASTPAIDRLIRQLGDRDYQLRQKAQEELARLRYGAYPALNAAAGDGDLEIASRARYLLKLLRVEWLAENDAPEVRKLLHDYEFEDRGGRQRRMEGLAALPDGQGVAALCRLVRLENSPLMSKRAAATLLRSRMTADPPEGAMVAAVRKELDGCQRAKRSWLRGATR